MLNIISNSECVEILRKSLKEDNLDYEDISDFVVTRAPRDLVGFMGEYYKLLVELKDKRKYTYFLKSVPIFNEVHRKECLEKHFFDKETRIYTDILGNIQKIVPMKLYPECYYTRSDILVLEDLSTQPLRHIVNNEDISFEYYQVVLSLLAHLHAGSIEYEHQTGQNIGKEFKDILFDVQVTMNNSWYVTGIKGIVSLAKLIPKYKGTPMEHFISEELYNSLCLATKLSDPSTKYSNVFCHRDTWSRNILFRCDTNDIPVGCVIVDFQLSRYCPQAIDVLTFLYMTTEKKQRDAIYDKCLDFYFNTFVGVLQDFGFTNEVISKTEFLDSCKELVLLPLILKTVCAPLMAMPDGLANQWRAEEKERFNYYMNTDRMELFERVMELEPGYKDAILEPLEELLEYFQRNCEI